MYTVLDVGERGSLDRSLADLKPDILLLDLALHLLGELARLTRLRTKDSASHEARLRSLTPREREVVLLIGEGVNNKKIASRLMITEHTVKAHLTTIFRKLGLSGRVQLALLANESGRGPISPTGWDDRSAGYPQGSTRPKSN